MKNKNNNINKYNNLNKKRINSTKSIKSISLPKNSLKKSFSIIESSKFVVPNKLIKYFDEKQLEKSYIHKLSVLLNSNDKNYKIKRPIINELFSDFNEKNQEFLTKYKNISQDIDKDRVYNSIPREKNYITIHNKLKSAHFPILLSKNFHNKLKLNNLFYFYFI